MHKYFSLREGDTHDWGSFYPDDEENDLYVEVFTELAARTLKFVIPIPPIPKGKKMLCEDAVGEDDKPFKYVYVRGDVITEQIAKAAIALACGWKPSQVTVQHR
ncbi:MAG: hypothetical protein ABIH21_04295 [Patescibacteria group bacterium]